MAHDPTDSDEWWGAEDDRRFDALRRGWKPPFPLPSREPHIPQPEPDSRGELQAYSFFVGLFVGAIFGGFVIGLVFAAR